MIHKLNSPVRWCGLGNQLPVYPVVQAYNTEARCAATVSPNKAKRHRKTKNYLTDPPQPYLSSNLSTSKAEPPADQPLLLLNYLTT